MDTSYRVNVCGPACPCRLEESRQGARCPCGISGLGEACAYCQTTLRARRHEAPQSQRQEDAARLDAVRAEAIRETRESVEESHADAKGRLSQPPSKPSKKRGTGAKRGPNRNTKARWAAEDAARGTSVEEFPVALLDENDPLPLLDYELDDLQRAIGDSLEGQK